MKYYCMCKITGKTPAQAIDSQGFGPLDGQCFQAPNRYGSVPEGEEHRAVLLGQPMECIVMGAIQAVCLDDEGAVVRPPRNNWSRTKEESAEDLDRLIQTKRHYPNVDIYRCPNCGAEIVVEG